MFFNLRDSESKEIAATQCSRTTARAINSTFVAKEARARLRGEPVAEKSASWDWGSIREGSPEDVKPGADFEDE